MVEPAELPLFLEAALHEAFEMSDQDGSGTVCAAELPQLLYYAEQPESMAPFVLSRFDRDESGSLSFDEVRNFMMEMRGHMEIIMEGAEAWGKETVSFEEVRSLCNEHESEHSLPAGCLQVQLQGSDAVTLEELRTLLLEPKIDRKIQAERDMQLCQGSNMELFEFDEEADSAPPGKIPGAFLMKARGAETVDKLCAKFKKSFGMNFHWKAYDDGRIFGDAMSEEEAKSLLDLGNKHSIASLMARFPPQFHKKHILKKIIVVKNLKSKHWGSVGGLGGSSEIWLNGNYINRSGYFPATLYHEMYHNLDANDNSVNDRDDKDWRVYNEDGFKYNSEKGGYGSLSSYSLKIGSGGERFLCSYAMASIREDKATLFGNWMAQRGKVLKEINKTGKDSPMAGKLQVLCAQLGRFCDGMTPKWFELSRLPGHEAPPPEDPSDDILEDAGAFLKETGAPDGQTWGLYLKGKEASMDDSGMLTGPWAESVVAAVKHEEANGIGDDGEGAVGQVINFLIAMGHRNFCAAAERLEQVTKGEVNEDDVVWTVAKFKKAFHDIKDMPKGISYDRFSKFLAEMGGFDDGEAKEIIKEVDTNENKFIDVDEFIAWAFGSTICDDDRNIISELYC